ncbi:MAG: hypothetical protein U0871_28845 [Gemmataceae bacterium]
MRRFLTAAFAALALGVTAQAHFVFVVPSADGTKVTAVLSEDLAPDENVAVAKYAGLKLTVRGADGKDTPVPLTAGKDSLTGPLPGAGPRVAFGTVEYGVMAKGEGKPYLLVYHPKAVVGPVNGRPIVTGGPLELVPVPQAGRVAFQLLSAGKPVADAEVTVTAPDGTKEKVKTGSDGRTAGFAGAGRFAAYGKHVEPMAGSKDGKAYTEVRRYATLVVDVAEHPAGAGGEAASPYPPLPVGASSLGAVAADGFLYVYGGHCGKTHTYDTSSVLGTLHRLKLAGGTAWEPLPGGPRLQGLPLVAHNGKVIRVGGMSPQNAPGQPTDNHSTAEVAAFDPATGRWEPLPPLPAPRSSHDAVVIGDTLVVVGGWNSRGKGTTPVWHDTVVTLDLSARESKWQTRKQPFQRRALTAAANGGKVYVVGGLGTDAAAVRATEVYDVAADAWTAGPEFPGSDRVGFSPAAGTVNGRVILNPSSGAVLRLTTDGTSWEPVGQAIRRRMVHRLVPVGGGRVVLVGGAGGGENVAAVEVLAVVR